MPSLPLDGPSSSSTSPAPRQLSYTSALLASLNPLPSSPAHDRRLETLRSICVRSVRIKLRHDSHSSTRGSGSRATAARRKRRRRGADDEDDEDTASTRQQLLAEEESTLGKAQLPIRIRPMAVVANVVVLAGLGVLGFHPASYALNPFLNDKVLHFLAFLLSTLLFYLVFDVEEHARRSSPLWRRMPLLLTGLTCFVVGGIGSEIVQGWLPYKTFDPYDILFNLLGSSLGLVIAYHVEARYRIRREIALLYDPIDLEDYEDEEDDDDGAFGEEDGVDVRGTRTRSFELDLERGAAYQARGVWDDDVDDDVFGPASGSGTRENGTRKSNEATRTNSKGRRVRFDDAIPQQSHNPSAASGLELEGGKGQGKKSTKDLFAIDDDDEEEEEEEERGELKGGGQERGNGKGATASHQEDAEVWR